VGSLGGCRAGISLPGGGRTVPGVKTTQALGHIVVDRAGVGQLFGHAEFGELLDDLSRLYFELPRQLIDSDLTHIQAFYLPAYPPAPKFRQKKLKSIRQTQVQVSTSFPDGKRAERATATRTATAPDIQPCAYKHGQTQGLWISATPGSGPD
jgi:hypothetical protein